MARRKTLTDAYIAALKPKAKRYAVPDPQLPSFYVRVTPTGAKSFAAVATDPSGKQIWTTIGTPALYSIDEAREKAREVIKAVRGGEGAGLDTFMSVAGAWLKRHVEKNGIRTRAEIERVLARYILPKWAGRDFVSIRRSDVTELLDHVEDKHGPRQADCCLTVFSSIANWYASRHDSYSSPLVRGMKRANGKERQRERVLSDDELRAVWAASPAGDTFGDLVKLLLLTGQRREKVVGMKWADVSEDGRWTIPASSEREKGNAGELLLPTMATDILSKRPRFASNPYVFAAARGKSHFSGYSKAKVALDKKLPLPHWQLHDLRRTARTLMSRAGVKREHAERVLGHVIGGVEGVYDQHQYDAEKAKALKALAAQIERILMPTANVTPMRRARA
jgi:integrase